MNKKQFQSTKGIVDRYFDLQDKVRADGLEANKNEMAQLCLDMVRVISELRNDYTMRDMERRLRRYERTK